MLNKSASVVLALLRGSTYRSVGLASSLAAALLDGLVEYPAIILAIFFVATEYSRSLLDSAA
jgi:hypothetical protein